MATVNIGRLKFKWQGNYSSGTAYVVDDVVYLTSTGSSYVCINDSTGNAPTNTSYWQKMAQGSDLGSLSGLTQGDIVYYNGTDWTRLAAGTSGQFLKTNGSGANPVWDDVDLGTAAALDVGTGANNIVQLDGSGNLPAVDGSALTGVGGGLQSMQVFTSSGTWTKPAGINKVRVIVTGGGAGGGPSNDDDGGNGGGAGATAIKVIDVSSVSSVSVTVGGGTSGKTNNGGYSVSYGNSSSFGSYCTAGGGSSGGGYWGYGGLGGSASGGDININGGDGTVGNIDTNQQGGNGGASYWGSGGTGGTYYRYYAREGQAYGSGGGGSSNGNQSAAGKSGIVVVEEYA